MPLLTLMHLTRAPKKEIFWFFQLQLQFPSNLAMAEEPKDLSLQEEYQLWRKNCRYMYEFVAETALTWPSLTVQWLPNPTTSSSDVIDAKLLLGTHTSGEDTDYVKVANTQLPQHKGVNVVSKIKISKKFTNNAEINRARYQPQNPDIVATINGKGEVDLYNIESGDSGNSSFKQLHPHLDNGYGLSWNLHHSGYLATSSDDKSVVVSDIEKEASIFKTLAHSEIVNDAKFHNLNPNLLGSVSDDKYFYVYDIRAQEKNLIAHKFFSGDSEGINTLAFSTFSENLVATGNTNSNVNLIDLRNMKQLHTLMGHSKSIGCLEFLPHKDGILASGSEDRRLILWDLFKVGEEQQQEDAEDGCPELFMMHAGHTGAVVDLNWCPFKEWTLASVADDNIVHLWEVGKNLLTTDEAVDDSVLE